MKEYIQIHICVFMCDCIKYNHTCIYIYVCMYAEAKLYMFGSVMPLVVSSSVSTAYFTGFTVCMHVSMYA